MHKMTSGPNVAKFAGAWKRSADFVQGAKANKNDPKRRHLTGRRPLSG
jgi:hypothetical protein